MTATSTDQAPTPSSSADIDQVERAVASLCAGISARAVEIEDGRRLPPDIAEALRQAGVFRLWLPAELGGLDAPPEFVLRIVEMLATADGSTGWCAMIGLGTNALAALLPEPGARAIFATGNEISAGALMPKGRAPYLRPEAGSRCLASGRSGAACSIPTGSATGQSWTLPPARVTMPGAPGAALAVRAGRGRRDPGHLGRRWPLGHRQPRLPHRRRRRPAGTRVVDDRVDSVATALPMWQIPISSLLFPTLAAVSLGLARRAVDELITLATEKVPFRSTKRLCKSRRIRASHRGPRHCGNLVGPRLPLRQIFRARRGRPARRCADPPAPSSGTTSEAVHAAQTAADVARVVLPDSRGTARYPARPHRTRLPRDAQAVTQHWTLNQLSLEAVGRALMDLDPGVPI